MSLIMINPIDKNWTHISSKYEFNSYCQCKHIVGGWCVSIFVNIFWTFKTYLDANQQYLMVWNFRVHMKWNSKEKKRTTYHRDLELGWRFIGHDI